MRIDRYELVLLISSHGSIQLWQGWDPALERSVSIRLLPSSDSRSTALAQAARRAATVDERRLVGVLDVFDRVAMLDGPDPTTYVAVVNEWVEGITLADLYEEREGEPIDPREAIALVRQVSLAVLASQRQGVEHGRLRPGALLLADAMNSNEPLSLVADVDAVRIRGLAVDAVMWPRPALAFPDLDAPEVDSDVHGIGCLLYATVTGRWPEGLVDGMSPAPRANQRLLPPSQVVASVPASVDEICMRAIDPRVSGEWPAKRGRAPYGDLAVLTSALGAAEGIADGRGRRGRRGSDASGNGVETIAPPLTPGQRALRGLGRIAVAAAALLVVGGIGVLGFQIASSSASPWGTRANPAASGVLTEVGAAGAGSGDVAAPGVVPGEIVPVEAMDHDPFGGDKQENPDLVGDAIDNDANTAWVTDTYYSPNLDGKPGVGLILDLGAPQSVSAVRLELVGSGSDVQVMLSDTIEKKPSKWALLAGANGVSTAIDLRAPRPVTGRYVLIWFTRVPPQNGYYQGGLRDVTVLS